MKKLTMYSLLVNIGGQQICKINWGNEQYEINGTINQFPTIGKRGINHRLIPREKWSS